MCDWMKLAPSTRLRRTRAYAANPLGDVRSVLGVAPHKNFLKAPELRPGALRVRHLLFAVDGINRDLDFHVSFNAGHGINNRYCSHISISIVPGGCGCPRSLVSGPGRPPVSPVFRWCGTSCTWHGEGSPPYALRASLMRC